MENLKGIQSFQSAVNKKLTIQNQVELPGGLYIYKALHLGKDKFENKEEN